MDASRSLGSASTIHVSRTTPRAVLRSRNIRAKSALSRFEAAHGGTITDLRGLTVLHQDDRSQFTDPGTEDRLRGGNPLQMALQPADLAGAYVFLSSRTNARGITGTILTVDAGAMLRIPRRSQSNQ